jgi:hypothetical protein
LTEGHGQETVQDDEDAFSSAKASVQEQRSRWKTSIGVALAIAVLVILVALVLTDCFLALSGHGERIGPLMQALQPYVLPPLGAVVGYAFGQRAHASDG